MADGRPYTPASPLAEAPFVDAAAERSVVGACFGSADTLADALAAGLSGSDFQTPLNRQAFEAMTILRATGMPVDAASMGGQRVDLAHIAEATMHVGGSLSQARCVDRILAATAKRSVYLTIHTQMQRLALPDVTADDVRADLLAKVSGAKTRGRQTEWTIAALAQGVYDLATAPQIADGEDGAPLCGTGLPALDDALGGGLWPQDLVLVGGRPGSGKSVAVGQLALHAARTMSVGFLALEMRAIEVTSRMIAGEANIDSDAIRKRTLTMTDFGALGMACSTVGETTLRFDDGGNRRIEDVCAIARAWHATYGIKMLVVDHLGKIKLPRGDRHDLQVGAVVSALKELAKTLGIVVVAAVQLSRAAEGVRPTMAHLRDSGELEQEANVILFPYRPDRDAKHGPAEIIIGKQRAGRTGTVPVLWDGPGQRFRDADDRGAYGRGPSDPLPTGVQRQADPRAKATRGDNRNWQGE